MYFLASDINVLGASSALVLLSSGTRYPELETFSASIRKMTFKSTDTLRAATLKAPTSKFHHRKFKLIKLMHQ